MNDEPVVEYLRTRGRVEPPFGLVESVADAVATTPQGRAWSFSAWIPAIAAVGAAAVILVISLLIGQTPDVGPQPAPSEAATPSLSASTSADPTIAPSVTSGSDLAEIGSQVTIDAIDQEGVWGSITLTRGPDVAGYPGYTEPGLFLVSVLVDYVPQRVPVPQEFGASDWLIRPTDPNATHFFIAESTNYRAFEERWPTPEPLLGECVAIEVMSTPCDGWVLLPVSVREAELELELVYATPFGAELSIRVRKPAASPDPLPTPTPAPGEPGYVSQPGLPFSVLDVADADALFVDADTCTNPEDGYTVRYPDSWYTNTEVGAVPACSWFTPTFFEVTEAGPSPAVWISIGTIDSILGYVGTTKVFSGEELEIGERPGSRLEYNPDPNGEPEYRAYHYVIRMGSSPAEGPTFIAETDNETAADYHLAKAVLDRIMASLEFTD